MEGTSVLDSAELTASLSHLSSQLLSHGYTSRPLDLVSLFLTPPPSHALKQADPGAYAEHVARIRAEGTARDQVVKCLWNMLGARMDSIEGLENLRSREMVGQYELERSRGLLQRAEKERDRARKDAEQERAKTKAAQTDLALEQERHRRARDELNKARTALQLVRTQSAHDMKRRETEIVAATSRLQRLTSAVPASTRLVVLNSTVQIPSPTPTSSITVRRRIPPSHDEPVDRTAELALVEEALEYCDEERRRCEDEIAVLRECLGDVGEWCGGVIGGVRGFEKDAQSVEEGEDQGDIWAADDSLLIPNPQFARPAHSFAPTIHAALHHIRTRILAVVDATDNEVEAARIELANKLEEERAARVAEEERRVEAERELENAKILVEQGERLVSDFATERFLKGVGGGGFVPQKLMYGDESLDEIIPGPTISQQEDDDRRAAAAKLVKERLRIEADRNEKKRRRAVALMLGELAVSDDEEEAPPPPPKPSSSSTLAPPSRSSSRASSNSSRPNSAHSTSSTSTSSSKPLPTLDESEEDRPSPFLARTISASSSTSSFAPSLAPPPPPSGNPLADILAMAGDDASPPRVPSARPVAVARPIDKAPQRKDSLLVNSKGKGKERVLGMSENRVAQKARPLHSTQTIERTKAVVTASMGVGAKRKTGEKENAGERRNI